MTRIMLDLETLGMKPGAVIFSIGAVKFGGGKITDEFYSRVDIASCVSMGMKIEPDTLLWWMNQSEEARAELTNPDREWLATALVRFHAWAGIGIQIWGNGAAFDNVLFSAAYDHAGLAIPAWAHRQSMCYRTVRDLNPQLPIEHMIGVKHNALDDARAQAVHLMQIYPGL